jgi:hypothetical protein
MENLCPIFVHVSTVHQIEDCVRYVQQSVQLLYQAAKAQLWFIESSSSSSSSQLSSTRKRHHISSFITSDDHLQELSQSNLLSLTFDDSNTSLSGESISLKWYDSSIAKLASSFSSNQPFIVMSRRDNHVQLHSPSSSPSSSFTSSGSFGSSAPSASPSATASELPMLHVHHPWAVDFNLSSSACIVIIPIRESTKPLKSPSSISSSFPESAHDSGLTQSSSSSNKLVGVLELLFTNSLPDFLLQHEHSNAHHISQANLLLRHSLTQLVSHTVSSLLHRCKLNYQLRAQLAHQQQALLENESMVKNQHAQLEATTQQLRAVDDELMQMKSILQNKQADAEQNQHNFRDIELKWRESLQQAQQLTSKCERYEAELQRQQREIEQQKHALSAQTEDNEKLMSARGEWNQV